MSRHATPYGAFHIDPMPGQPQIALCTGFFVKEEFRGKGHGHLLKRSQMCQLVIDHYDYAMCTVDSLNSRQKAVLREAGWQYPHMFDNNKTGTQTEVWGWQVRAAHLANHRSES